MAQKARTNPKANAGDEADAEKRNVKKEHVRKKAWRPKTKTGCVTCR